MTNIVKDRGYLKINKLFSQDEINILSNLVNNPNGQKVQEIYGRMRYFGPFEPVDEAIKFEDLLTEKVNSLLNTRFLPCKITLCVTYSLEYGEPSLPPHFDGDSTDLILNYQLESNTTWPVGVGTEVVELEDNSAILFNPNEQVHWRTRKKFNKGEYVKMVFIRFQSSESSDYSHLRLSQTDPIFSDAHRARDRFDI